MDGKDGEAFVQADQSYCFGASKPIPDAIEVVATSTGMNKLARYQVLGVPEVWFWEDGALTSIAYETMATNELLEVRFPNLPS